MLCPDSLKPTTDECTADDGIITCAGDPWNKADYTRKVLDITGAENGPTPLPGGTATPLWSCKPKDWNSQAYSVSRAVNPSPTIALPTYDSIYGLLGCSFPGIDPDNITGSKGTLPTIDFAIYSRIGSFKSNLSGNIPDPDYIKSPHKGGWLYLNADGTQVTPVSYTTADASATPQVGAAVPLTGTAATDGNNLNAVVLDWNYAYVEPGSSVLKAAVIAAGFSQPHGCMFEKSALKPDKKSQSYNAMLGATAAQSVPGTCSSDIMKSLNSTCEKLKDASTPPTKNMCTQLDKQEKAFEAKLKKLQNEETWYQSAIKTMGGIVDDFTPGGIIRNFGKALGAGNDVRQKLNNSLNINIDINQSQQAEQMCINVVDSMQTNSVTLNQCPNPYPELINNVCGLSPCGPCQARTGKPDTTGVAACEDQSDTFTSPTCPPGAKKNNGPAATGPGTDACKNYCTLVVDNKINTDNPCSIYCDGVDPTTGQCKYLPHVHLDEVLACQTKCRAKQQDTKNPPMVCQTPAKFGEQIYEQEFDEYTKCINGPGKDQIKELTAAEIKFHDGQRSVPTNLKIDQSSKNKANQSCSQDTAQKALANMSAGINNEIQQMMQQKAEKMMAHNKSDQDQCNNLNIDMSACNYQSTQACCSNTSENKQVNEINIDVGCSPINGTINQDLKNSVDQLCNQGVKQSQAAKGDAQIKNKIAQAAAQTAVGIDPTAVFIIIVIIIGIIALSPVALTFVIGTKILLIMGIIIMLIGFAQFPVYFATKYSGENRKNTPFVFTSRKETNVHGYLKTTWASAFEQYKNDDTIQGFDFFPDCLPMPNYNGDDCTKDVAIGYESYPAAIQINGNYAYPNGTPGQAIFYSSISKSAKAGNQCVQRTGMTDLGNDSGDKRDANGGKMYTPYICELNTSIPKDSKSAGWAAPTNSAPTLPVFKGGSDPSENGKYLRSACKVVNSTSACILSSVSYVKDYALSGWLISAIVTTIIGILFLGVGIWIQTSGKSHQRQPIWRKNKTAPVNAFNSKSSKNAKMQQSKSTTSRRKSAK